MLKVVITAGAESSLEVTYLKSFFELYGIFVTEKIPDYNDYDFNNANIDWFYIAIKSDSLLNELKRMSNDDYAFYNKYNLLQKNTDLFLESNMFPKIFSNKEEVLKFWKKIIEKINEIYNDDTYNNLIFSLEEMVNMFLDINPIKNFYLLDEVNLMNNTNYKSSTIKFLEEKLQKYQYSLSPYTAYAYVKMLYEYGKYKYSKILKNNELTTDDIYKYHTLLTNNNVDEASLSFIMALLCFDRFHVNMLTAEFFESVLNIDPTNEEILYIHDKFKRWRQCATNKDETERLSCLISSNSKHYNLLYVLGLLYTELNDYQNASNYLMKAYNILDMKRCYRNWNTLEMVYYCKCCGRLIGLNINSEINEILSNSVDNCKEALKDNILFRRLSTFLEDDNQLYNDMVTSAEIELERVRELAKGFK